MGNVEILQFLHLQKCDLHQEDKQGVTPLYITVEKGHDECLLYFARAGVDLNKKCQGRTPIYAAVQCQHFECVIKLISFGANVNSTDRDGSSPGIH